MAWQEVETDVGSKSGLTKYSVALKHGGARVSIPAAIVEQLGWTDKTGLKLLVGGGDKSGMLRIEPQEGGRISGRKPPNGGQGLIIRLGRWKGLAPRDVDAVSVDAEVNGAALIVTLPQHARNEPPPPKPALQGVPTPPPVPAKADVTNRFFNDPKKPPAMASGTRGSK